MMNLHYGDARNKNNSTGQNKFNKLTSNTYASSLINYTSTFPTLTSSLNSNNPSLLGLRIEIFLGSVSVSVQRHPSDWDWTDGLRYST